jgi:alpha-soluble NSF attachment protein
MAESNEMKAADLMERATKRTRSWSLFGNNTQKFEDAAELFAKAANHYKIAKNWQRACDAYSKAAEANLKAQSKHEAATNYINAANCIKKDNPDEAIRLFHLAVDLLTDEGRFSIAAKHQKEIAEIYESEMKYDKSMEEYQKAGDLYEGEGSTSSANSCFLKVAQFAAQLEQYDKAIQIFEKVAKASVDNNLLKWSVKEYLLKAGLCYLAKDIVAAHNALEKFQDLDYSFSSQRECKFLQDLLNACDNMDVDGFTQAVADFDNIIKLDPWKTTILLRIKNKLKSEDSLQ